jgi:hypothetical protein
MTLTEIEENLEEFHEICLCPERLASTRPHMQMKVPNIPFDDDCAVVQQRIERIYGIKVATGTSQTHLPVI